MSRYFVLISPGQPAVPYIIAEVVREEADAGFHREDSIAAGIAGALATIVTGAELNESATGREALRRWGIGDDSAFDAGDPDEESDDERVNDAPISSKPKRGRVRGGAPRHLRAVP